MKQAINYVQGVFFLGGGWGGGGGGGGGGEGSGPVVVNRLIHITLHISYMYSSSYTKYILMSWIE